MTERITLPPHVREAMCTLSAAGFEVWAVGGCVRDSLLGITPHDWDLCTDALPEQMLECFAQYDTYTVGSMHGTVAVKVEGRYIEITTLRADGAYTDNRRPDSVLFVRSLREDLARRDFTVNAMAYSQQGGLIDLFGGREDLRAGLIRCVGEPARRFEEDALRILRALRFASRYGFELEAHTAAAAKAGSELLSAVSQERIFEELKGIIRGTGAGAVLRSFPRIFLGVLPELSSRADWSRAARGIDALPGEIELRLALLLHPAGAQGAKQALERLRCDKRSSKEITALIAGYDMPLPNTKAQVRRLLHVSGLEHIIKLAELKRAGALANCEPEGEDVQKTIELAKTLMADEGRITLKTLAVGGDDLMSLGIRRGPELGKILKTLLEGVLDGKLPNEKEHLLEAARSIIASG